MLEANGFPLAIHIAQMLRRVWNPIDLGEWGPEDEYDSYVPGLVALACDTAVFEEAIVAHLARIKIDEMHLSLLPNNRTRAARAVLGLRHACHLAGAGYDALITQAISLDGLRCLWVFRRPDGLYAFEHGTLQFENDENGRWSWWRDVDQSRSGLFATAEAAEREARAMIAWLQDRACSDDEPFR